MEIHLDMLAAALPTRRLKVRARHRDDIIGFIVKLAVEAGPGSERYRTDVCVFGFSHTHWYV